MIPDPKGPGGMLRSRDTGKTGGGGGGGVQQAWEMEGRSKEVERNRHDPG